MCPVNAAPIRADIQTNLKRIGVSCDYANLDKNLMW
jgi:hypothetical protein